MINPCGGLRWETQDDGLIAVEGQGVPAFEPGSLRFQQMTQTWQNWSGIIQDAASATGVPARWILVVMCQETGLWSASSREQATKVAPDGGLGLMQIMPKTALAFGASPDDMLDPEANVAVGSALLAKLSRARYGELPEIVANYNAGGVRCGAGNSWGMVMSGDYVGNAIRWNNSALMYLDMRPRGGMLLGMSLGAIGVYAAAVLAGLVAVPRMLRAR